ncbi:hypothetical protein BV898_17687 [Hypsibius exemplaris]|uniref:Uncharacterized protein n=1 Tax=Hypsibius exemplaris TaxID=2072580 RepID=A0A9X6RMA7_HYPEX|nr:hypothetical protein BV898_17687 [Hypsibius exemplaris]
MKINPFNVFRRLVRFYENEFKESSAEINGKKLKLADEIASLIDHILDSSEMRVENETELDIRQRSRSLLFCWLIPGVHMDEVLVDECKPKDLDLNVRIIPPGTTEKVQPFDVFYFWQKKTFVKFGDDRVIIDDIPII